MTTRDERHEVAGKLRQMADAHDATEASRVARALGLEYKVYGTIVAFDSADIRNLADLIDPSTSATTFTPGVGLETYPPFPIRLWKCARCGEETIMMYDEGEPVACPYCGAVVVSDDD